MRRAKWDSGYRPTCRKCNERPASEHRYVAAGNVICDHCEYIRTPNGLIRSRQGREFAREYKKTHPCIDCGEADWRCLDFDHMGGKRFKMSDSAQRSIETVKSEIEKCVVRCANCHRKRHLKE